MNAAEQRAIASRLRSALVSAGILIERGTRDRGNLSGWEEVSAEEAISAWLQKGWSVSIAPEETKEPVFQLEKA